MREWLSLTEACLRQLAVASIGPLLVSFGTPLFRLLREWRHVQQTQDDGTFGKAAVAGSGEPWKNGHHFDISEIFFSCTPSDSQTILTASLALAITVELSLLSVEEQENRGHGWYMQ